MTYQVEELLKEDGTSPYADWFNGLDAQSAAKVTTAKVRMVSGNFSSIEWFRGIGEYKIDWGPGLRIYLARDGEKLIVLLGGGTKRGQQRNIDRALKLWQEYKQRKSAAQTAKRK